MNDNVIKLFMWGYQRHFRVGFQVSAENLFNEVDKNLMPKVFLLGVLVEKKEDSHEICLEPEDCGYNVSAFSQLNLLARELEKVNEEAYLFHTHPIAQANHDKRVSNKAYIEAIGKVLKREDFRSNTEKFISYPTFIDGYLVFTILEISKDAVNAHYSLIKDKIHGRYKISRSFIESVIDTFLKECTNALNNPNQGHSGIDRLTDELLREAGNLFMYTISNVGNNEGLHGLYDTCNAVSALKYEGADGLGKLVIANKNHSNIRMTLKLEEPIRIRDFRKVRKFLELSDDDSLIISDSVVIYGLGELRGRYNPKEESLFIVNFSKHYHWEVLHDDNALMSVAYRQPNLPKERLDRAKFYSDFTRVFKNISNEQVDDLWDITLEATKQKHGTMLVISDIANEEANRLGNQCFKVSPQKLTKNIVQKITSIDGCILIDRNSVCHAIGVILDGIATEKGDSSRGARYNSAIRYFEYKGHESPMILVIISEDGMINLIPNLLPQIKHSYIIDSIADLKELSEKKELKVRDFNKLMQVINNIRFYLTDEECKTINSLKKTIEQKDNGINNIRIVHPDLTPNKEMNDSYYME